MTHTRRQRLLLVFLATAAASGVTQAQTGGSSSGEMVLQEVVVTAQKRTENNQNVPIAIDVISGQSLAAAGVKTTSLLQESVPGLNIDTQNGAAEPHLRGIGSNTANPGIENSVATYVDGVYYASPYSATFTLDDVERVEVLEGPQGTLFGRNAAGGVIQVITKTPSHDFHGDASVGYGNYQTTTGDLYVTGGVTDHLAADLAAYASYQNQGYGTNLVTGHDVYQTQDYTARSKWLWTPTDRDTITFSFDYNKTASSAYSVYRGVNGFRPELDPGNVFNGGNPWNASTTLDPNVTLKEGGTSVHIQHDFGFAQLLSISAYRDMNDYTVFDPDDARTVQQKAIYTEKDSQVSQEFQLLSPSERRLRWVTGAYFIGTSSQYDPLHVFGSALGGTQYVDYLAKQTARSYALYGQATYRLAPKTDLTLGARYTSERHHETGHNVFDFPFPVPAIPGVLSPGCPVAGPCVTNNVDAQKTWSSPTWRVAIDHHFTDELMGYLSYNRGFKSGAFNIVQLTATQKPINPETLDAYEIGLKSQWLDNRLRVNVGGFFYNYKNLQVTVYTLSSALLENGPRARLYGSDLDIEFLARRGLTISAGLEAIHSEFLDYPNASFFYPNPVAAIPQGASPNDCVTVALNPAAGGNCSVERNAAGDQLPLTPKFTGSLAVNYTTALAVGTLNLDAAYYYNSGWFPTADNSFEQPSYGVLNSQISWESPESRYMVTLWSNNLTDKAYASNLTIAAAYANETLAPPRTYGLKLTYTF